jgi:hypothetical protein
MAGGHHVPLPACEAKLASASTPTSGAPPKTSASAAILIPTGVAAALERQEVDRVGRALAAELGLTYRPGQQGEYVSGKLAGVAALASGSFSMIDDDLGFRLVSWQSVLDSRVGQHITGIDWTFGHSRGLRR